MTLSREIHLASRPTGPLEHRHFNIAEVEIAPVGENEALIRNLWMSVDAGQRTLMGAGDADIADLPPKRLHLGEALEGQAIGQVVDSTREDLPVGALVISNFGWREYFKFSGKLDAFVLRPVPADGNPPQSHLHVMSLFGAAAYYSLTDVARIKPGETIWVSTAAGAVGSLTCQVAKLGGCRVIGTTSSDAKAAWLRDELGIDVAINYKAGDLKAALKAACPEGIDVFIDFVGGPQLETAIDVLNPKGRIVKIGETSAYDGAAPVGPKNIFSIVLKRLRFEGFTVFDYLGAAHLALFQKTMSRWLADGKIVATEAVYDGIENAIQAQLDLFAGKNIGKVLVKLGEPQA